ncbi:MAG: hypothetical protein H7328_09215 [Bdellovibrio sp.]|nr:hypothetical protein [Bdellovibrio sp.]
MKMMNAKILSALVLSTLISTSMALATSESPMKEAPKMAEMSMSLAEIQANSSSAMQIQNDGISEHKGLGITTGLEYAQKNAVDQRGTRDSETNLLLAPSYTINSRLAVSAKGIITKQNSGPKDTTYSNTTVTLSIGGIQLNDQFKTLHSVAGVLPTSQDSQKIDRLKGGVSIKNGISFDYDKINLKYSIVLSQNFHEFNFNADGDANVQYRLGQSVEVAFFITDRFYITAAGIYRNGVTYGGFDRTAFGIDADLNYDLWKNFSLNLGTSNEGSAYKSNGVDSNISAYNDNTSVVRAGMSYVY